MAQTAKEIIEEQYGVWRFQEFLRKCARQSAEQLRDAYKMQKVWDGTRENSVWFGRGKHKFYKTNVNMPVKSRGKKGGYIPGLYRLGWKLEKTVSDYSWYDEVQRRKQKQQSNPQSDYWYSDGKSFEIANQGAVTVVDATREHGEIDFKTTWGAMWAEIGAGLTGQLHTRGARSRKGRKRIKIDRKETYKGVQERRYVDTWTPMQGKTHRPLTRRQVNLFRRRLRWAAQYYYRDKMVDFLTYSMYEVFDAIAKDPTIFPNGYVVADDYVPSHSLDAKPRKKK